MTTTERRPVGARGIQFTSHLDAPDRLTRRVTASQPSGFLSGLCSMLLPGAGQFLTGARERGLAILGAALFAFAGAVHLLPGPGSVLQPRVLVAVFVASLLVLYFRLAVVLDAVVLAAGSGASRGRRIHPRMAVAVAVLIALTAAPHAVAGYYVVHAHDMVTTVFVPREQPLSAASLGSSWHERERITIALLGSDAGGRRDGARTDTLMVASFDPRDGRGAIFSVPRNMRSFPVPAGVEAVLDRHCPPQTYRLLFGVYACASSPVVAEDLAALYPDSRNPAASAVAATLGEILGLPVDHYALLDAEGFMRLVDAVGGIEVHVGREIRATHAPPHQEGPWQPFSISPGLQRLDGQGALAFVRSRTGTSDYDRMRRQRCLVAAFSHQTDAFTLLWAFPTIAALVKVYASTDIPIDKAPDLIELVDRVDVSGIRTLGFEPPTYQSRDGVPDLERIRERVRTTLHDAGAAPRTTIEPGAETVENPCA